jgi:hypothetical protein
VTSRAELYRLLVDDLRAGYGSESIYVARDAVDAERLPAFVVMPLRDPTSDRTLDDRVMRRFVAGVQIVDADWEALFALEEEVVGRLRLITLPVGVVLNVVGSRFDSTASPRRHVFASQVELEFVYT